jgi:Bacterial SH3 domain
VSESRRDGMLPRAKRAPVPGGGSLGKAKRQRAPTEAMMRLASLACSLVVLLSGAALAAQGDALVVTGNGVNVRLGPERNAKVVLQVYRNDPAVELGREGDWVEVRLPNRDATGWIHASLVALAGSAARPEATAPVPLPPPAPAAVAAAPTEPVTAPEPAPEPAPPPPPPPSAPTAAAPAPEQGGSQLAAVNGADGADALARFRDSVTYLNNRAVAAAGIDLFTGVAGGGDGVVQVTATDAWANVPRSGKESFMRTLYDRWLAAAGGTEPLRVQVVDRTGQVLMEKSGP